MCVPRERAGREVSPFRPWSHKPCRITSTTATLAGPYSRAVVFTFLGEAYREVAACFKMTTHTKLQGRLGNVLCSLATTVSENLGECYYYKVKGENGHVTAGWLAVSPAGSFLEKLKSQPSCHGWRDYEQRKRSFHVIEEYEQTLGNGNDMVGICVCVH